MKEFKIEMCVVSGERSNSFSGTNRTELDGTNDLRKKVTYPAQVLVVVSGERSVFQGNKLNGTERTIKKSWNMPSLRAEYPFWVMIILSREQIERKTERNEDFKKVGIFPSL